MRRPSHTSKDGGTPGTVAAAPTQAPPSRPKPSSAISPRAPMRCREIMQRPVRSVLATDSVFVAARIMREEDVGFLPVSDPHGMIVGILTDRDIATRVCAAGSNASDTIIRTVMTTGVIACRPDDTVSKASKLMRRHRVTRIVVLNRGQRPLGILSLSDIAQYDRPANVGRTFQSVAERKYSPARP